MPAFEQQGFAKETSQGDASAMDAINADLAS